jgi:hypothetical protein
VSLTIASAAATGVTSGISPTLRGVETASEYAKSKDADSTQQGYAADLRLFTAWCAANNLPSMPATSLRAGFITSAAATGATV